MNEIMALSNLKMNTLEISLIVMKKNALTKILHQLKLSQWIYHIHRWTTYQLIDTSTDNPSTDNSTSRNPNSSSRSMNLGGASQSHRYLSNQESPINYQEASSSRSNLPSQRKWTKSHPFELIIGDARDGVKTRSATQNECLYSSFLSQEEPKKVEEALQDVDWVLAMQEELN